MISKNETEGLKMIASEELSSENTVCIPVEEYERLFLMKKINEIVSTMSLSELEFTLDLVDSIVK